MRPVALGTALSSNQSLLGAALAGLLCLAPAGCSTGGGSDGAGADPNAPPHITSSEAVGVLSEADFKALCDARGGTVELMPHCGGFATAKGFSYDNGTHLLSEHTCAGANTCGGWNCALTD
jgi:hypothetical protein